MSDDGCGANLSRCGCTELAGHDTGEQTTPHVCPCGGSWVGQDGSAGFEILSYPEMICTPDGDPAAPIGGWLGGLARLMNGR